MYKCIQGFRRAKLSKLSHKERDELKKQVMIVWREAPGGGKIVVHHGELVKGGFVADGGTFTDSHYEPRAQANVRLLLEVEGRFRPGADSTRVSVGDAGNPFTFWVRDVSARYPVYIPAYGVIVTEAGDGRTYGEIEAAIRANGLLTHMQRMELEEEANYEAAAGKAKDLHFQTWLGISRDIRIFAVEFNAFCGSNYDWVQPKLHFPDVTLPETNGGSVRYNFRYGRGAGYSKGTTRHLEEGVLPIVHGTLRDDEVIYKSTIFATLEHSGLAEGNVRGTHYLVAGGHTGGNMFTPEQLAQYERLAESELDQPEETVLYYRIEAMNTARVPRFCYVIAPAPNATGAPTNIQSGVNYHYDHEQGYGIFTDTGRIYAINTLNGQPMPDEEMAVLLQPGETATFIFAIPHRPIPVARATRLAAADFAERHAACRNYWLGKLAAVGSVAVPERRIDEMYRAGLLHLDLIMYGLEPAGTVAPAIGIYSPIGSESAPIIMHMDSVGWHSLARRSIMYFIDKQHESGLIQNFQDYMLETGCVMWLVGEHYRYTRDEQWVQEIKPQMRKAFEFTVAWRRRNEREELRGKGYGMLDGKAADPEDPYHSFMLNGYAYIGMQRMAEIYADCDPAFSAAAAREAEAFKQDIRTALFESLAQGPAVPLGDGSWCPTVAPWTESIGPVGLFADSGKWYTHGTMFARDSLLGPLYLIYNEVVGIEEPVSSFMLNYHAELMCTDNVVFSQPYYSRHPWVHLMRGEVKPFLRGYYHCLSALADRETYTFGEHLYAQTSPHKTHEEGWFLMETRWMLYMEAGRSLKLLPGIPRAWLEPGKAISLNRMASYFGAITLQVQSRLESGFIHAVITLDPDRLPDEVAIRLPHPDYRRALRAEGGEYDPDTEVVRITAVQRMMEVKLFFG